jgi:hypothetical protein
LGTSGGCSGGISRLIRVAAAAPLLSTRFLDVVLEAIDFAVHAGFLGLLDTAGSDASEQLFTKARPELVLRSLRSAFSGFVSGLKPAFYTRRLWWIRIGHRYSSDINEFTWCL